MEATALGNVLTQMLGLGLIGSLSEGRAVVRRSFDVRTYEPRDPGRRAEVVARQLGRLIDVNHVSFATLDTGPLA